VSVEAAPRARLALGVDVGGTFTKAVAVARGGPIVTAPLARAAVPTTHGARDGVAEGVVAVLQATLDSLGARRHDVDLVGISSTQAVNALLEGDVARVAVLGLAAAPDLRRARRRTRVPNIEVAPGRELRPLHAFLDASSPLDDEDLDQALDALVAEGAEAVAVSHAFSVDDPGLERRVLARCAARGLPACGGHELTGLYGLELRTRTAVLNASILPAMAATADRVQRALERLGLGVLLLVVRGDGGAATLGTVRTRPVGTLFSGPAASVTGVLRSMAVRSALIVEHGGTSTNVSVIADGRPVLDYVRVMRHPTCVRALDVRVVGVAGGSLLRVEGRRRLSVGPRSAHLAGLPYACFAAPLADPEVIQVAPRPGDPATYLAARDRADGRVVGLTLTCCANALGALAPDDPAHGDRDAARRALMPLAARMRCSTDEIARGALEAAASLVAECARPLVARFPEACRTLVSAGGAGNVLGPAVAHALGCAERISAPHADVISSVGAASGLVRVEIERTVSGVGEAAWAATEAEAVSTARARAISEGLEADQVAVDLERDDARGTLRAVASGALPLTGSTAQPVFA
jgi:N-methylhydantoinase A